MSASGNFTISNEVKTTMRKHVNKRTHLNQEVMITFIFKTGMIIYDYESTLILVPYLVFFKITIWMLNFICTNISVISLASVLLFFKKEKKPLTLRNSLTKL
jgi:hypothetical protein